MSESERLKKLATADSAKAVADYGLAFHLARRVPVVFHLMMPGATAPYRATDDSAGADLFVQRVICQEHFGHWGKITYGTGLIVEIPKGYYGDLRPRSSIRGLDMILSNSCGVIDPDYRGEIMATFWFMLRPRPRRPPVVYEVGDRFLQLIFTPFMVPRLVTGTGEISQTGRGSGGYGSTGLR